MTMLPDTIDHRALSLIPVQRLMLPASTYSSRFCVIEGIGPNGHS